MLRIEGTVLLPEFGTNTWLLWDDVSLEGVLIDPSAPSRELLDRIQSLKLKVKYIVNTHGHGDHIGGNSFFRSELSAQLMIHSSDAPMLTDNRKNFSEFMGVTLNSPAADVSVDDGFTFSLGEHSVRVIHTPGHTRGCICLLAEKFLISGDTLFELSIGRTDLPGGSHQQIVDSIRSKLYILHDDTVVYPGHGPRTTIGMEKKNNPFVKPL